LESTLIDVEPDGLQLRELAAGVSVEEVRAKTEPVFVAANAATMIIG
jgi:acyl CoA:acetate/3-ketoacid CoA transferase beta subunit